MGSKKKSAVDFREFYLVGPTPWFKHVYTTFFEGGQGLVVDTRHALHPALWFH